LKAFTFKILFKKLSVSFLAVFFATFNDLSILFTLIALFSFKSTLATFLLNFSICFCNFSIFTLSTSLPSSFAFSISSVLAFDILTI